MKRRKKDQEAIENKLRNRKSLKKKRAKNADELKNPQKFIKQYRNAQKSYAYLRKQVCFQLIYRIKKQQEGKLQRETLKDMANYYWS